MEIFDFTLAHIEAATRLAKENYLEERQQVSFLPKELPFPDLKPLAENGLGVVAFEQGELVGFLSCLPPFSKAFGTTKAKGVFSPIHGNGTVVKNRGEIYARLYQAGAKKWVDQGITSHSIALYGHDEVAKEAFFQYGFGLRCVDALKKMEPITMGEISEKVVFSELNSKDFLTVFSLEEALTSHLKNSPAFYPCTISIEKEWLEEIKREGNRFFVGRIEDTVVAYIKTGPEGENFVTHSSGVVNITGAFTLPWYRGKGIFLGLMNFVISALRKEGYPLLGVDFESFNPTAKAFWLKHFIPYTLGVVRRIDEDVLGDAF